MTALDGRLARLAAGRHRIASIRALRALGFSKAAVSRRTADGQLTRLHRGVYLVGPPPPTERSRWLAAVIACGEDAVLSHRHAGMLLSISRTTRQSVDVSVPRMGRHGHDGITVHATRPFHPDDTTVLDGIPVTSVERTLLDLAEVISTDRLKRAYERAEKLRILDHRRLRELIDRSNGRRGVKALLPLLDYDPTPANEVKSEMERMFLDLVTESGLPPYGRNVVVGGYEVDAYWPEAKLVVELQSYTWHSDRAAFERDHEKLGRLRVAGYKVLALTYRQLTADRDWAVEAIATLLGLSGRSLAGGRA